MKRLTLSIVAAAALFSSLAALADSASVTQTGQTTTPDGWFIQVKAGASNSSYDEGHLEGRHHPDRSDFAKGGLIGYRWAITDTYSLGIEGGYTRLGQSQSNNIQSVPFPISLPGFPATCGVGDSWRVSSRAAVLGAAMKWNVSGPWTFTAHAGAAHTHATHDERDDLCVLTRSRHTKTTSNGEYAGLGFGYDLTPSITLALNADMYWVRFEDGFVSGFHTTRVRVLGASAEYRF
ncbi:outer membrane beta-barrel protein [Luteibacter sp. SG786]|uniref:outer membrane beta-barrel protein n=1 Tax=Luteibacter sp. SG786 TaxID=2587130 RepID=UPI00141EB9D0|nr:outer membrane beta-barrel protein [Luteibacter sp. SG786]NII55341.1 opacity protein-like surface antigen [Luteibacter sp. SG786]